MRERFTGSRLGWVFRGGAILLLATSLGCNKETANIESLILPSAGGLVVSNTPTPMVEKVNSLKLMSVITSCEGDKPVAQIENWLVGGKSGSELDVLILASNPATKAQVLAVLGIVGVRENRTIDDHIVLSYKGEVFAPDAKYTDYPVAPFPKRGGERYSLERRGIESMEWDGNKRVLRFGEYAKAKARVTFQVTYCSGTSFPSG